MRPPGNGSTGRWALLMYAGLLKLSRGEEEEEEEEEDDEEESRRSTHEHV